MKYRKIDDSENNGAYHIMESGDFEYVDPVKHYSKLIIESNILMEKEYLELAKFPYPIDKIEPILLKRAVKFWKEMHREFTEAEVPPNLIDLLNSPTKKDQVRLLKGLTLSMKQLTAFTFKACADHGFTLSHHTTEHHHQGLDTKDLPQMIHLENENVRSIGSSSMTKGEMKHAVKFRKVTIAKLLDCKNQWHCFFYTYKSIGGKERAWKEGQPHLHYLSDKFGTPRSKAVAQLKSRKYNLGSLPHIDLVDKY